MQKFKYIIFDGPTGLDGIIFPPWIEHKAIAAKYPEWKPLSAGFVEITSGANTYGETLVNVSCYGKSVSLKLSSQPGDERAFQYLIS